MNDLTVFNPITSALGEAAAKALSVQVKDEESKEIALEIGKSLGGIKKKITTAAKTLKDPLNAQVKKIITVEKSLQKQVSAGQDHLKSQLLSWEQVLEKKRKEEAAKLEEERRKVEEEKRIMAAKDVTPAKNDWSSLLKTPEEIGIQNVQKEIQKKVELDQFEAETDRDLKEKQKEIEATRVKGATKVWKYEVTSESEVPREFFTLDHAKIKAWMKDKDLSTATINGVKFFQETRMSLR